MFTQNTNLKEERVGSGALNKRRVTILILRPNQWLFTVMIPVSSG